MRYKVIWRDINDADVDRGEIDALSLADALRHAANERSLFEYLRDAISVTITPAGR